jgi:hypothetical protein
MQMKVKSLVLIAVLMMLGGTAFGQSSLKEALEQEGFTWMLGRWKTTTDDGTEVLINYRWALDGHAIVYGFEMGERQAQGLIYFDAMLEEVRQFSVDNRGRTVNATWATEYDSAVCNTTMYNDEGRAIPVAVVYSKVNNKTMKVAVYGMENGSRSYDPWFETNFAKQARMAGQGKGIRLFNGRDLTGWEYFLVEPGVQMKDVWSVRDGLLVCKGEPMGYLATKRKFKNFKLVVEWRWAPGQEPGNSGVLMRITGKPQALPKCAEAQLKSGSAGDIYGFHGFQVKGDAARSRTAEGELFGQLLGVSKIKGNEKEPGQWNKYEITLKDGDLTLLVNGEKVNEATGLDVVMGKIGLQSEGGEIHFRTVQLYPL